MTVKLKTTKNPAIEEWIMKEYGSWEDSGKNKSHPCAILQRFGKVITMTNQEAKDLLKSAENNSTGWSDDEIVGGRKTKLSIAQWAEKIRKQI